MSDLYLEPTSQAQWSALIYDARKLAGLELNDSVENYLILTLEHFTTEVNLASTVFAIEFLSSLQSPTQANASRLRDVGDQCLLISGLFPERALRKNVSLNYFIRLGKSAYHSISHQEKTHPLDPELFYQLSLNFVGLMDILHHMRLLKKYRKTYFLRSSDF